MGTRGATCNLSPTNDRDIGIEMKEKYVRKQTLSFGAPFLGTLFFLLTVQSRAQDNILTIHYVVRPPYVVSSEESLTGMVAGPVVKALNKAGLKYRLAATPFSRQLVVLKKNRSADCMLGWFKNSEREKDGLFSEPIHTDGKTVLLANARSPIGPKENFAHLAGERRLRLLVKSSFSYGPYIDAILQDRNAFKMEKVSAEAEAMAKIVAAGRVDMMLVAMEEAAFLLNSLLAQNLKIIELSDAPKGQPRYLYCTKLVPLETLRIFNQALLKLK